MSGLKEIRRRIGSVQDTKQITKAMNLVSAAKLNKAKERCKGGEFYAASLERIFLEVVAKLPDRFSHPLLEENELASNTRIFVIAGERGLCGAYNSNVAKEVEHLDRASSRKDLEVVALGRRAALMAKQSGWNLIESRAGLPENTALWPVADLIESCCKEFANGRLCEVAIFFTKFYSPLRQEVKRKVLLPFQLNARSEKSNSSHYTFSRSTEELFKHLLPQVLRSTLLQCAHESKASEHASRMTAMDSATTNASELIDSLKLQYNRARQSAITSELMDIIGGAEAV